MGRNWCLSRTFVQHRSLRRGASRPPGEHPSSLSFLDHSDLASLDDEIEDRTCRVTDTIALVLHATTVLHSMVSETRAVRHIPVTDGRSEIGENGGMDRPLLRKVDAVTFRVPSIGEGKVFEVAGKLFQDPCNSFP